jgi:hypothetical protein
VAVKGTYDVEMRVVVRVTVRDPDVIRRPVENIDGWRNDLYDLKTRDDVLAHLAFNCVRNGSQTTQLLDGWADLPRDAASMVVSGVDFDDMTVGEEA